MKKGNIESLFKEFNSVSVDDWYNQAKKEINKNDLSWNNYEGIVGKPIYTRKDNLDFGSHHLFQHNQKGSTLLIDNVEVTSEKEANKAAITSLKAGSDGIQFLLKKDEVNITELVKGIWLDNCVISFSSTISPLENLETFFNLYAKEGLDPEKLRGWLNFGSLKTNVLEEKSITDFKYLEKLFQVTSRFQNYRCLTIPSHQFANYGASIVQEVAYSLSLLVDYLEELNPKDIRAEAVSKKLIFSLTVGTNFFFEISKLRALRVLVSQIFSGFGVMMNPSEVQIHTQTSLWNKSYLDWENNIIRNSAEAMAGIIGGTDYLTITDHHQNRTADADFPPRVYRNISHILKEEAYLNKVVDPSAGSYYIESLTHEIADKSWELFLSLEKEGGFSKSYEKGIIKNRIDEVRQAKLEALELRKDLLIGVNIYPNLKEDSIANGFPDLFESPETKASSGIENLRSWTEKELYKNGKRPTVLVLNFQKEPISKIQHSLIKNIFQSAGFNVEFKDDLETWYSTNKGNKAITNNLFFVIIDQGTVTHNESTLKEFIADFPTLLISSENLNDTSSFNDYISINSLGSSATLKNALITLISKKK